MPEARKPAIIRVEQVQWFDTHPIQGQEGPAYPGCDGCVWYEITHPDGMTSYMMQVFSRNGPFQVRGVNIWHWDGNREAPTLDGGGKASSSFGCTDSHDKEVYVHLHFTAGKMLLDGCANVVGAP